MMQWSNIVTMSHAVTMSHLANVKHRALVSGAHTLTSRDLGICFNAENAYSTRRFQL